MLSFLEIIPWKKQTGNCNIWNQLDEGCIALPDETMQEIQFLFIIYTWGMVRGMQ
jgi:hypothetical protein